ncbi:hypothetical protein F4553_006426 [Allocatelliglobosispora scoriae]|uniref:DUF4352 domain-containing protein n=1 Tax=Allocatelliglobosispora scoriae TaxID=643052 RepID=A0A841C1Q4_9ACTN|nr:DUF4352 domain-containing protein [Allocatelliglobosispora scoriae]MBB5872992.1 hypothetical protein [Allocatelliglobosispora scoriae]
MTQSPPNPRIAMTLPPLPNDPIVPAPQNSYPVGAVVNGFQWDGTAWRPFAPPPPKRSNSALWITLGVVGAVMLICFAGFVAIALSSDTPAPSAGSTQKGTVPLAGKTDAGAPSAEAAPPGGPATVKAGTQVPITTSLDKNLKVTVRGMKTGVRSSNQFDDDTGERGYITVDIEIVFVDGADTYLAEPSDFKLIAADGTVYESETFIAGISGNLDTVTLNPGQKTSGKIVFDAPKAAAKGAKVQYVDFGKAAAFWQYA